MFYNQKHFQIMSLTKSTLTKAFNNLFIQFLEEVIEIVPENKDIRTAKTYFEMLRNLNPALIIKVWYLNVYSPYKDVIDRGDIVSFLIEKDYNSDLVELENANEVLEIVHQLRKPISEMSENNRQKTMEYIKSLSKLSDGYNSM